MRVVKLSFLVFLIAFSLFAKKNQNHTIDCNKVKNVIVLVPDGCGNSIQTLARYYKGASLAVDKMLVGAVKTHMANSLIMGSQIQLHSPVVIKQQLASLRWALVRVIFFMV